MFLLAYHVPRGGTSDFKWRGWSNGGKNQNPQKNPHGVWQNQPIPGPKINPKKSHTEFLSLQNFQKVLNDITCALCLVVFYSQNHAVEIHRHYHEPSYCIEYRKKPKTHLPNFATQKHPGVENFKSKKNRSIIPVTWSPEYPLPLPPPPDHEKYTLLYRSKFECTKWLLFNK